MLQPCPAGRSPFYFEGTDLAAHLRRLGVTTVVVAGLATAHGVFATAATAVASGHDVVVVSDATASVTAAEHTAALDQLIRRGARVRAAGDLLAGTAEG